VSPVPPQHGAWAFLGLPFATALTVSPWTPVLLLLAVTWVCAYPASYFLLALVRDRTSRRPDPGRFTRPLALWWAVTLAAGLPLLLARPWLVWVAVAYGATFLVNLAFARRHDERALVNDLVFIVQCTAMVPVTWMVATGARSLTPPSLAEAPAHLWVLTVAVALLLVGSTLHVKSLIRERADPRYARASRATALVSLLAATGLAAWWGLPSGLLIVLPFAYFAVRSWAIRTSVNRAAPRPAVIGMVELVGFVLLVVGAALAGLG
jgi:hypothetical protein